MQYQDPLNPIDSTDYATQLATFSGVEQAVLTNDLLKSLTTQMNTGGLVDMAALVGKEVRSTAPAYFDGQPLTLRPEGSPLPAGVYQCEIVSKSGEVIIAQTPVEIYSSVNEVRLEGGATILVLTGGVNAASDQVTALRDGGV